MLYEAKFTEGISEDVNSLAYVHANAAWSAIKLNNPTLFDLAGKCSEKAFSVLPEGPEIAGTRGAYLIVTGQSEEGLALILPTLRSISVQADKADFCIYISQAYQQLDETDRADIFSALAQHLKAAS